MARQATSKYMNNRKGWLIRILIGIVTIAAAVSIAWWGTRAGGVEANIVVNSEGFVGPLPTPWRSLAQGGEVLGNFLDKSVSEVAELSPQVIRIDHIYDMLAKVKKSGGAVVVDWSDLDRTVRQIQKTGATPFLSLSYMPPAVASGGDIVSPPSDWNDWTALVQQTIEHYSGALGIPGVYYEVWNEPDLFGKWRAGGNPNYFTLYRYAAMGAARAKVGQRFYFGGPATTAPYRSWVEGFLDFVKANNLRLDFYSWHRYSFQLDQFDQDIAAIDSWFSNHPDFNLVPKIISEFGVSGDRNGANDLQVAAAHEVAVARATMSKVKYLTAFSVKDAFDPQKKPYWGDWGIFTSDETGAIKKPRYFAILFLNRLGPDRLSLAGEGSWVRGIAAKKGDNIQVLLVNYDPNNTHVETTPVRLTNLSAQQYEVTYSYLSRRATKEIKVATNGELALDVYLPPETVVMIEAKPKE